MKYSKGSIQLEELLGVMHKIDGRYTEINDGHESALGCVCFNTLGLEIMRVLACFNQLHDTLRVVTNNVSIYE